VALARHRPVSSSSALPLNRCCGSRCSPSAAGAVALRAAAVAAAAAVGSNGGSQSAAAACCPCASGTPAHVAARDSPWQAQLRPAARRVVARARRNLRRAGASRGSTVLYLLVSSTIIQHTVLIFPVGGAIQQVLYGIFAKSHTSQEGWKEGESERH
jgi:hypothetical protein